MIDLLSFIQWNPNEVAISLGFISLRWYSMCWLIGLIGAYFMVKWLYKDQKVKDELFDPLFIYCFLGILIGARLGHCLFTNQTTSSVRLPMSLRCSSLFKLNLMAGISLVTLV